MSKRMHRYTSEEGAFIRAHAKGITSEELTALFNKHFALNLTAQQIRSYKHNKHILSGIDCRFKLGRNPTYKGKGWPPTHFKKGNIPGNRREVGSERVDVDGYTKIKVSEHKWLPKHKAIWEAANGPIPKGHHLMFADGDKSHISLDNLILVTQAEELLINRRRLLSNDPELSRSGALVAKMLDTAFKRKKDLKKKREGK